MLTAKQLLQLLSLLTLVAAYYLASSGFLTNSVPATSGVATMTNPLESPPAASPDTRHKNGEVYFVSHGGAFSLLETKSRAYRAWQDFGARLIESKPRGIVIISAHWESDRGDASVLVNADTSNPIIHDFYGFPDVFYQMKIASRGSAELSQALYTALESGGVDYRAVKSRGLDHGAWIPLLAGLGESTSIPLVQVSLPGDDSPLSSIKLGRALGSMRSQGYAIIGTGQVVHNLRHVRSGQPMPYTVPFLQAAQNAAAAPNSTQAVWDLFRHPLFPLAHPTAEHFLPFLVAASAAGVAGDPRVEEIWVGQDDKFGLGWGTWRWY